MNEADNVVLVRVIHRQAGVVIGHKKPVNFRIAAGNVTGDHIYPGGEDLFDPDIIKLNGGFDQVTFRRADGSFVFYFIHHDLQLCFCNGWLRRVFPCDGPA